MRPKKTPKLISCDSNVPRPISTRPSRSSTSTRSGPTRSTSNAAPHTARSASPSKSVRCRALQERVLARDGFAGTLAFTLPEALWLARHRFEDIVVAYPTADRAALRELARLPAELPRARVTIMVDDTAQLDLIDAAPARRSQDADPRLHRPRRRLPRARRTHRHRRQALARAHPRAGRRARPCDPRARHAAARRDHVLRGAHRRPRRRPARPSPACARDPRAAVALRPRARRPPRARRSPPCASWPRWSSSTPAAPAACTSPRASAPSPS